MIKFKKINSAVDCNVLVGLAICLIFYFVLCFSFGVQICADSKGYIEMVSAREPVYPLFLAFMRWVFGEAEYLNAVIVIQNLLMAVSVWLITAYLKKECQLNVFTYYVLILSNFAVALLCQFVAKRGSIYSNSILTEGIAIPLWLILILTIWKGINTDRLMYVICIFILCAVMMDIRKQMAVGYIVAMLALFIHYVGKMGFWRKMVRALSIAIISLVLAVLFTRGYNYLLRGSFAQNTRDMNLVLTTSLYVADEDDGRLIEEDNVRELFNNTYEKLTMLKANYSYAGDKWYELSDHYEESYDKITIDTTADDFVDFAVEKGFASGMEAEKEADRMSSVIVKSLLGDNISKYIEVYEASLLEGLVNTVAKKSPKLNGIAALMYVIYTALCFICIKNKETRYIGIMGAVVLISCLVNAGVIAALIFCQTRYMIYNMALFYMMLVVMLAKTIAFAYKKKC